MKTITLDHIVRNSLLEAQLPLHYYVRFLHYGIRQLEELNYDNPINVKRSALTVTSYKRAVLPSDCVDVVEVYLKYGEHVLPLSQDPNLNTTQKYDANGNKIAYSDPSTTTYDTLLVFNATSPYGFTNDHGEHTGRHYGSIPTQKQSYVLDYANSELVFDNAVDVTEITITYVSNGVSTSAANVVHPYAQDTIEKYIHYCRFKNSRSALNKVALAKQEYINAKRKLKSRLNAITYADVLRIMRQGVHGSIKN